MKSMSASHFMYRMSSSRRIDIYLESKELGSNYGFDFLDDGSIGKCGASGRQVICWGCRQETKLLIITSISASQA